MSRKEARAQVRPQALARAMRRIAYPEHLVRELVEESPQPTGTSARCSTINETSYDASFASSPWPC
jgi:hypothetical protein